MIMIHSKCYQQVTLIAFTVIYIYFFISTVLSQNLTITPRYQCANSSVSLICEPLHFTTIKWRNGSTVISSSLTDRYTFKSNHTILVIQNITDWDNGSIITCSDASNSSISNPVTILVHELLDRPQNVSFTNTALNLYTITWEGFCDDISLKDKPPAIRYILTWYNFERDILGSSLVLSSCKEDSQKDFYTANFTSISAVVSVSVSAENTCGIGEATNVVNNNSLITVIPERYTAGQMGQTLTISCVSSHDNSTLEWFQEQAIGSVIQTTDGFFSSNQSITFNVTKSYVNSIFYCTFENHPIYYNVFTQLIVLKKPLAFIINGSEVSSEFIINTISSTNAELNRILCVGTEGNRQLLLHVITTNLSGLTQYSINTQNYSAAIEITIKTQNLPILFKSTLTCTSIGSRENVSLIITHSFPVVTVKPTTSHAEVTQTVTFTAAVREVGLMTFTYQWMHNGSLVDKENGTTLTIANIMESDGGNYSCLVTTIYGETIYSNIVTLIVSRNLPVITNNPVDVMIKGNGSINISFTCGAEGATSYKWERQGGDISSDPTGVNTSVLTIYNIQPNDTGYYRCIASNASGSSFSKYAMLELIGCALETDNIYGLNWPNTKTGELATIRCNTNNATRLCNNNNIWGKIDVSNCETDRYSSLLMAAQSLSNGSAAPGGGNVRFSSVKYTLEDIAFLAILLSNYTRPVQNLSILPLDIQSTNDILSSLLTISEIEPSIFKSGYFVNGTAGTFSNILDVTNAIGWNELLTINESSSQQLLSNSEKFSLQLANHTMFSGVKNLDIIEDNIILSTVVQVDNISDILFPPQNTVLNSSFAGPSGLPYASIVIPSSVLKRTSLLHNGSVAVGSVLYRTISRLLPNYTINNRNDTAEVASMILSTQILDGSSFAQGQDPIELNFQLTQSVNSSIGVLCGFFDENVNGSTWSTRGLTVDFSNGSHIRCLSNHLTTFAVLLDLTGSTVEKFSKTEIDLLNLFTFLGCSISLICLALTIFILLIFYKSLLKDLHYFVHFNLSIALFMGLAVFLGGIDHAKNNNIACKIVAALLHYFFTAVFTWMMCEGIMIYLLLVKVFKTNITNKRWPFLAIGWGIPALIVGIAVGVAHDGYGNENNCWLSFEKGTIWGFVGPVLLFIIINLIFLIMGVKATLKGRISRYNATNNHEDLNKAKIAKWLLRDTLFLLPMFGITWVFGLLAFNENLSVFAWLFVFFNTTQGLLIFLLYIMKQKKIRNRLHLLFCCSRKPVVFVVKSIPMFHLSKSHKHKAIDPAEITVEVNRYVTDPL